VRAAEWYCDANVIGLAQFLARVKLPVTWPGDGGERRSARLSQPPCPISDPAMPDEIWIPEVTKAGLTIRTRDSKILQLRVVAAQWPRMLERRQEPGPFIDSITLTATRRLVPDRVL